MNLYPFKKEMRKKKAALHSKKTQNSSVPFWGNRTNKVSNISTVTDLYRSFPIV